MPVDHPKHPSPFGTDERTVPSRVHAPSRSMRPYTFSGFLLCSRRGEAARHHQALSACSYLLEIYRARPGAGRQPAWGVPDGAGGGPTSGVALRAPKRRHAVHTFDTGARAWASHNDLPRGRTFLASPRAKWHGQAHKWRLEIRVRAPTQEGMLRRLRASRRLRPSPVTGSTRAISYQY